MRRATSGQGSSQEREWRVSNSGGRPESSSAGASESGVDDAQLPAISLILGPSAFADIRYYRLYKEALYAIWHENWEPMGRTRLRPVVEDVNADKFIHQAQQLWILARTISGSSRRMRRSLELVTSLSQNVCRLW